MLKSYLSPLLYTICLLTQSAHGQFYNFKNYNTDHGLPVSAITALCQDQRGNLWIGTRGAGLIRFDGYAFQVYLEEDGLSNNFIQAIHQDKNGVIWIGTEEGLNRYDGVRFSVYKELGQANVQAITSAGSRGLWVGTSNGLFEINGTAFRRYGTNQSRPDNNITCLYADRQSNLWVGTTKGIGKYNQQEAKFFSTADGLGGNVIHAITEDFTGKLWVATGGGLSVFDGSGFTNHQVHHVGRTFEPFSVIADRQGDVWTGTNGGIFKFNGTSFGYYDTSPGQGVNSIRCAYVDAEGNLWFGSQETGLFRLDSERFTHYPENDEMGKRVFAIIEAINGNLICGTSLGGTTVFDGKQYALLNGAQGFTSSIVQAFYYTPDSSLWVATQDEGAFKFSKDGMQGYSTRDGLPSNNISAFTIDAAGGMWIASGDSGVTVIHSGSADSLRIRFRFNTRNGLASDKITSIIRDRSDKIWIGTEDNGLNRITISPDTAVQPLIEHFAMANGLSSNEVHGIRVDPANNVFVGTSAGILIYRNGNFIRVSRADGLVSNNVYSLVVDSRNNLWAGTERGVDKISFGEEFTKITISHFGNEDGFKGVEVYRNSSCEDRAGNIWFGTINGLVRYNPAEEPAPVAPRIHLTGIRLFFDNIANSPYVDSVSGWYPIPAALTLPYHQNNLTFTFAGIYHRNPGGVRYKWMMEGFDKSWSPPVNSREAVFSNLPPGAYTFRVMAANEYNVWTEPASFSFRIESPLWQRWWAQAIAVIAVGSAVWLIFSMRIRRLNEKNRVIRERLEMENSILQLEQEAARLQMNPHFIFNCLNSIQGFISSNNPFEAKKCLAKFARLMRLILENAREEFIPLENEIQMLENYVELEKLTTDQKFDFSITMDDEIDPETLHIPPMMVQPFVENSIMHGIKKKNSPGMIKLHFGLKDDMIVCELTDNGIGRKRAAEINSIVRREHRSTAISITTKRLEQYGDHRNVNAGIQIQDLEENGQPLGTRVIVRIPYEGFPDVANEQSIATQ